MGYETCQRHPSRPRCLQLLCNSHRRRHNRRLGNQHNGSNEITSTNNICKGCFGSLFCFLQVLFMGLFGGFASFCAQNYCHVEQIICKSREDLRFNRILTLGWWYLCGKATGRRRRMVISVGAQSAAVRTRYFAPAPTNEKSRRINPKSATSKPPSKPPIPNGTAKKLPI